MSKKVFVAFSEHTNFNRLKKKWVYHKHSKRTHTWTLIYFPHLDYLEPLTKFRLQISTQAYGSKGCFYSESTDVFFISPNRWTKFYYFKGLKSSQVMTWRCFERSNKAPLWYLSLQSSYRSLFDIIWAL